MYSKLHNVLIFTPPPHSQAGKLNHKPLFSATPSALLHTAIARVGRASLFLLTSLLLASCSKDPNHGDFNEHFDTHAQWGFNDSNQFWN